MTYLIYEDGLEINRIVADEDFCARYCGRHGYTYRIESESELLPEPAPQPEPSHVPTREEDTDALLTDHEYRLTLLELGLTGGDA